MSNTGQEKIRDRCSFSSEIIRSEIRETDNFAVVSYLFFFPGLFLLQSNCLFSKFWKGPKIPLKNLPFESFITFKHKHLPVFLDFRVLFAHFCVKTPSTGRRHWSYASLWRKGLSIFTLTSTDMVCACVCLVWMCILCNLIVLTGFIRIRHFSSDNHNTVSLEKLCCR